MTFSCFCALERPLPFSGNATLDSTVRERMRLKCWKIMPIFRRTPRSSFSAMAVSSRPSTNTRPEVGFSRRLMHRTSVDLPAPEKPMMP